MTKPEEHKRITGADRERLIGEIKEHYDRGMSIRAIAKHYNRSYGNIHKMLTEAEVPLRGRGGAVRVKGGLTSDQAAEYAERLRTTRRK